MGRLHKQGLQNTRANGRSSSIERSTQNVVCKDLKLPPGLLEMFFEIRLNGRCDKCKIVLILNMLVLVCHAFQPSSTFILFP